MSTLAQINELDLVVYGQVQYDFSLSERSGLSLGDLMVGVANQRAVAVDHEISAINKEVKQRARKLEALGQALGYASAIVAEMSQIKNVKTDTKYTDTKQWLAKLQKLVAPYDLTYTEEEDKKEYNIARLWSGGLTYGNAQKLQSVLQLALDKENNALKRTTNTIQSFITKRDNAYELIAKLRKKIDKTASTTISSLGV